MTVGGWRRNDPRTPVGRSIQQSAAVALGRLANYSDDLAEAIVQNEILPQLVSALGAPVRAASALALQLRLTAAALRAVRPI